MAAPALPLSSIMFPVFGGMSPKRAREVLKTMDEDAAFAQHAAVPGLRRGAMRSRLHPGYEVVAYCSPHEARSAQCGAAFAAGTSAPGLRRGAVRSRLHPGYRAIVSSA